MTTTNPSDTSKTAGGNKQNTTSGIVEKATELTHTKAEKAQDKIVLTPPPEPRKPDAKAFATDFLMGIGDCFQRVIRDEGARALWRGNTANVLRYFPTQAFNFGWRAHFKTLFDYRKERDGYAKWFMGNLASGGAAGASSLLIGLMDVYKKTLATDGVAGLYRGFLISSVGIVVYRGLYFGLYDSLKPMMSPTMQDSFIASYILGFGVTTLAGLASYPIDTVRRRMMMTSGEAVKYKSSADAFRQIVKHGGYKSLFKGAGANILRAVAGGT
ncbi:hypothetical protein BGZ81_007962 [Podila clonocystis]|nr:hypothetical protein BGZ81_007962 [Podila clonocystis]